MTELSPDRPERVGSTREWLRWLLVASPTRRRLIIAFLAWLGVFLVGLSVPSKPFRDLIIASCFNYGYPPTVAGTARASSSASDGSSSVPAAKTGSTHDSRKDDTKASPPARVLSLGVLVLWLIPILLAILVSFTPTNLLLLCVLGALLGAYAVQLLPGTLDTSNEPNATRGNEGQRPDSSRRPSLPLATAAVLHGLCVFLGVASGLFIVQGQIKWDEQEPSMYLRLAAVATLFSVVAGSNPNFLRQLAAAFKPFSNHVKDRGSDGSDGSPLPGTST